MNITDHLRQAVESSDAEHLDLHRLARVARHQGMRARRRRRGSVVLGAAVVVGLVALGSTALSGRDADRAGGVQVATTPSAPTGSLPFTGRAVAAALRSAVSDAAQGRAGAFAGQAGSEAYAQLDWTDADGRGVSVIGVNVQPGMDFVSSCGATELHCTRTVTGGATLTTYEEHTPVAAGVGIRRVADLLRADGTRIVVSATNGYDLPSNRWDVTRPQPPLDTAQLTRIASLPWWGPELPAHFLEQGRQLAPYDDPDSPAPATPTSAPATP